jgi:hypothetical protein
MTKHRTITSFTAIIVLAIAAATMRSHSSSTHPLVASAGMGSLKELMADVNKLPTEQFDDQSLVFSTGTSLKREAAN